MTIPDLNQPFYIPSNTPDQETVVYIGKGAGKQINERIEQAKNEIVVISPYISSSHIETLLKQAQRGVSVKVAFHGTTDKAENLSWYNKESLRYVVNQHKFTNKAAKAMRDTKLANCVRARSILRIACVVGILLSVAGLDYAFKNANLSATPYIIIAAGLLLTILTWIGQSLVNKQKRKAACTTIYNYAYDANFEVNCIYNSELFIHSKIYVIDSQVAYIGSANFTKSGFNSNIETRVCIKHAKTVKDLHAYALGLMRYAAANSYSTDILGKALYDEPLY